jgi:hypothetical protein
MLKILRKISVYITLINRLFTKFNPDRCCRRHKTKAPLQKSATALCYAPGLWQHPWILRIIIPALIQRFTR